MKASILHKLDSTAERLEEIAALLSDPSVISDQKEFRALSQEYSQIEPTIKIYNEYKLLMEDKITATEMQKDADPSIKKMGEDELISIQTNEFKIVQQIKKTLIPIDPNDSSNIFLEIRAGTGGDEAAIFSGDLFRMYSKYAESKNWKIEIMNIREGDHGGYKEIICKISGDSIFSRLKFESGAHRVQRVPQTESQGRVHTSACSVAILPEIEALDLIEIDKSEIRVDTFRASGAGGQHVNKTDSAVRLTHIPTGLVVECQDGRSQHKNKAKAMTLMQTKLMERANNEQNEKQDSKRKDMVGSGDRSEKIRTYNFPQNRITDHRIEYSIHSLEAFLDGDMDEMIETLIEENQARLLSQLEENFK